MNTFTIFFAFCISITPAFSGSNHDHMKPPSIPKALENMKQLKGTWEGMNKMHDQEVPMTVIYSETSGGTVLEEKLMPGTPHEMVSMYHKQGKTVGMTHYCAIGNQPKMKLTKSDDKSFSFVLDNNKGIESPKEAHMHSVKLTLTDKDTLVQEWENFANGKKAESVKFTFKRK